jgi:hypothetical protein
MRHTNYSDKSADNFPRAIANQVAGKNAKSMPAVPVLQNKETEENEQRTLPTHSDSSTAPIQMVVQSKHYQKTGDGTLIKYYSTFDSATEFDTKEEAWKHDRKLFAENEFDPHARVPTNYSYYNTKSTSVVGGSGKQGPHTLSHSTLAHRFEKRMNDTDHSDLMEKQVLTIDAFEKSLEDEKPTTMKDIQVERMVHDYTIMHNELEKLLDTEDYDQNRVHDLMMRLMQMNPYTVYGKTKTMSKKALKNKNESRFDKFEDAFDDGGRFRKRAKYEEFSDMREHLYSSDLEEDAGSEKDEDSDSEEVEEVEKAKAGENTKKRKRDDL